MQKEHEKTCFVISPLGAEDGSVRQEADQLLRHVILPAAKECNFRVVRADEVSEAGLITDQILRYLTESHVVVADLTNLNANVMYELGIRHAVQLPALQVQRVGERLPFDISWYRTVYVNTNSLDSVESAVAQLASQMSSLDTWQAPGYFRQARQASGGQVLLDTDDLGEIQAAIGSLRTVLGGFLDYAHTIFKYSSPPAPSLWTQALSESELLNKSMKRIADRAREIAAYPLQYRLSSESDKRAWIRYQKERVLQDLCELFRGDPRRYQGSGDDFKATLFRVENSDLLVRDACYYPDALAPQTVKISRDTGGNQPVAHRCIEEEAMQVISSVPDELAKGKQSRWVSFRADDHKRYGSLVCVHIAVGNRRDVPYEIVAVLTIDTNRIGYFCEERSDVSLLSTLLAPYRQVLSYLYAVDRPVS